MAELLIRSMKPPKIFGGFNSPAKELWRAHKRRKMRSSKWFIWMVLGMLVFTFAAEAAEGRSGSKVGRFFRGLFRFPAKTTEKSVGVATEAAKGGTAIGTGAVENVGGALTGSKEAAVGIVKDPLTGAATTTYETTKGAIMAPVEGAKEAIEEEQPSKEHPGKEHPGN